MLIDKLIKEISSTLLKLKMNNLFILLSGIFFSIFILGKFFEKFRIPWIFSGLFVGIIISFFSFSSELFLNPTFIFLAEMGMYFLLFIIGFEINIKKSLKQNSSIVKTAFWVILLEIILGSLLLHYLFDLSWSIAILVASSFATVGEAVLLPILDEYKLTKTKLGQRILSVGIIDDIFEILIIIIVSIIVGSYNTPGFNILYNFFILFVLFFLVFLLFRIHNNIQYYRYKDVNSLFLFVLFFIFLFIGIGEFIDSSALGALLAGISLRNLVPQEKLMFIEKEIQTLSYGFLAPIFFVWIGLSLDFTNLTNNFKLIGLIILVTIFAKILGAYISNKKEFGTKKSIFMGLALSVKLSTGIVVLSVLLANNLITKELFSVLIGASIVFTILIPITLPFLIKIWKIKN